MRKAKERLLYSNYDLSNMYETAKQDLIHSFLSDNPDIKGYCPSSNEIWNTIYCMDNDRWRQFEEDLTNFMKDKTFILQGTVGTWQGAKRGGFIFNSLGELSRAWKDCDYVKIYDKNGHLYVDCSHHDGSNHYEIRQLNNKGIDYSENHYWDDTRTTHDKLMQSPYSVLPHFAHKVFGRNKVEYEKE